MSKFVGFVVGAIEIGIGIATGNVGLIVTGGLTIAAQAAVDLTSAKTPARNASEMLMALGEQPRCALMGETFTAGSLVDVFNYGGKYGTDWECLVIRLADHKCAGLTGFYVNDEYLLYTGDGSQAHFGDDRFEIYFRSDTSNQPLPAVVLANGPGWTADDIGRSGCDVVVCYKADAPDAKKPVWPGGRPRFGFVVKGKLHYDSRKDSTVSGGAGPHRWENPATWEFSENPVICRYNWARGIYADDDVTDPAGLLIGRGLSAIEAPPENIIAAANVCDEALAGALPYLERDTGSVGSTARMEISTTGAWMVRYIDGDIQWWNLPTRSLIGASVADAVTSTVTNIDLGDDGTAYFFGQYFGTGLSVFSALYTVPPLGTPTHVDSSGPWFSGPTRVLDLADGTRKVLTAVSTGNTGYMDLGSVIADAKTSLDFALHSDGSVWGLFEPSGSSAQFTLKRLTGSALSYTVTGLVTRSATDTATFCHVASQKHWFVITEEKWYTINDDTTGSPGTIKASGDFATGVPLSFVAQTVNLPRKNPSKDSFWSGFDLVSLVDGSIIESVDPLSWLGEDTQSDVLYDPAGNALVGHAQFETHATWRFLGPGIRFRVAGPIYANQDFIDVELMFGAAVAGNITTVEGSVELEPAQAKSPVVTITDADLLVGSRVKWNDGFLSQADSDWVNTVVARYVEPSQSWNDHAAPVARVTADIIADGRPREASVPLRLVRDGGQAQVVEEITRRLGRIWGRATITLGPRHCELEDGDWINWQSDRYFGGGTKTFRIDAYSIDKKWQNTLTIREIAASVYADDVAYGIDQSNIGMTPPPPAIGAPGNTAWALVPTTLASTGASVPALVVSGASDDDQAAKIRVEYWKSDGVTDPTIAPDAVPWTSAGDYAPGAEEIQLPNIAGGSTYYAAVSYIVSGIAGDRLVLGPEVAGDFDITAQIPYANAAEVQAGTVADKAVSPQHLTDSAIFQVLADGATTNWDMAGGFNAKWTLGGNHTLGTPTNPKEGLTYSLLVIQDATGTRVPTWPACFDWGSAGAPAPSAAAGKKDLVTLQCLDAAAPLFRAVFSKAA